MADCRLYGPREVGEILGVSREAALRIMRQEMRAVQTGSNPANPRYKVTMDEIVRWTHDGAAVQEPRIVVLPEIRTRQRPAAMQKTDGYLVPRVRPKRA